MITTRLQLESEGTQQAPEVDGQMMSGVQNKDAYKPQLKFSVKKLCAVMA